MSEAKPNQEPTMEEILASIRRIISEDGDATPKKPEESGAPQAAAAAPAAAATPAAPSAAAAAPPPPPPAPPQPKIEDEEVLELTEVVAEQAPPPDPQPLQPPAAAPMQAAPPPPPPPPSPPPTQPTVADLMADDLALVSAPVAEQAASKFSDLASTVSQVRGLPVGGGNRTLEDIVKELLRPMLKDWLDANLPTLVHRIVEREVAKLAGRVDESQGR